MDPNIFSLLMEISERFLSIYDDRQVAIIGFLLTEGFFGQEGISRIVFLGDGTNDYRTGPVQVGGLSDVAAIGAAAVDSGFGTLPASFAVKRDGTVWAWGFQEFGRFDRSKPVQLIPPGARKGTCRVTRREPFTPSWRLRPGGRLARLGATPPMLHVVK